MKFGRIREIADRLEQTDRPVLNAWELLTLICAVCRDLGQGIRTPGEFYRVLHVLRSHNVVRPDRDYANHFRIVNNPDRAADDVVCLVDQFCHIAFLSAMQAWGLTDRQSFRLMICRPDNVHVRNRISEIVSHETAQSASNYWPQSTDHLTRLRLRNVTHPRTVRGRTIALFKSRQCGHSIQDRNDYRRISTIGQTFLDMLRKPERCGGMAHVLEVWEAFAPRYLNDIIPLIEDAPGSIKCRAGHIIEERLKLHDRRVLAWRRYAQRGGSRRLDPQKKYVGNWSTNWMISLNV